MIIINSGRIQITVLRQYFIWAGISFMTVFILKNPADVIESVKYGLSLCARTVVPALFPFMILSNLVIASGLYKIPAALLSPVFRRLFAMNGNCASALVLGMFSGFPVGAKTAVSLYEKKLCSKNEAERLMAFSNNAGPGFVISCIGISLLGDAFSGRLLYLAQLISALLCGVVMKLIFCRNEKTVNAGKSEAVQLKKRIRQTDFDMGIIPRAVLDAGMSLIPVCAFILFFSVSVRSVLSVMTVFRVPEIVKVFAVGMIEAVSGAELAAGLLEIFSKRAVMTLLALVIGFSGISVHMQVALLSASSGLGLQKYFIGKIIQSLLCAAVTFLFFTVF